MSVISISGLKGDVPIEISSNLNDIIYSTHSNISHLSTGILQALNLVIACI